MNQGGQIGNEPVEFTRHGLGAAGFNGFLSVAALHQSRCQEVPGRPGVYVVLRDDVKAVRFLETSCGGHYNGREPSVARALLEGRWLTDTPVLYLGMTTSLRRRVQQLVQFGAGEPVRHWGGRYLWQVADSQEFVVAWRAVAAPIAQKRALLAKFAARYGQLPFANINR